MVGVFEANGMGVGRRRRVCLYSQTYMEEVGWSLMPPEPHLHPMHRRLI